MKKKLAIIRADDSQLPFVVKAKEMGIETHCFAWDKEGYTHCKGIADYFHPISILDREQILEKCKELKIAGVITKSDNAVATVAFVAEGMGLVGNRYEDMLIASDKYKAHQAMLKKGVNSPRFAIAKKGQMPDLVGFKYPLVVKPTDRKGSIGVVKINTEAVLMEAIQNAQQLSYSGQAVVEEFAAGTPIIAAQCVSWKGKHHIVSIDDSEELEDSFYKTAYHHPASLNDEEKNKTISEVKKALDALNFINGASEVEFILTTDGDIKIIEVNPRMAGETEHLMAELSTGYDLAKGAINIALNNFEEPVLTINKCSGLYYLRKETEYLRSIIENSENDPEIIEAVVYKREFSTGELGHLIYQSDRKRSWKPQL